MHKTDGGVREEEFKPAVAGAALRYGSEAQLEHGAPHRREPPSSGNPLHLQRGPTSGASRTSKRLEGSRVSEANAR